MTVASRVAGAGRRFGRPALVAAGLAVVASLAYAALVERDRPVRGPAAVPNPLGAAPAESVIGGVRHVFQSEASERLVLDTLVPDRPARLLWFQGRAVSPTDDGGVVTLDGTGGVMRFDRRLAPRRLSLRLEGHVPISVAAARGGGFWVVGSQGEVLRTGPDGRLRGEVATPFDYPAAVADPSGGAWLVRSTALFAYRLATATDPLLLYVDSAGGVQPLGAVRLPEHILLAELGNAGHLAVSDRSIFYAPFIRDEVVALSRAGDTLWVAHRGLPQSTPEPRFEIGPAGPTIDYAPVNLGLAPGADGRLYVLSLPGRTTSESRVDVYDPLTGALLRSARLASPLPTLAADADGRVYQLDPFTLLTGVAPAEREVFRPFDLERLGGGRLTTDSVAGRVVLINFWASWCGPCRVEMPALDSLRRGIADPAFQFLTMNEDIHVGDARAFLEASGFDFPVLLGRGKLKTAYHYVGLPFTVLLDREGRVVQRWIGFAGAEQIAGIRAVVVAELERGAPSELLDERKGDERSGGHRHAGH